MQRFMPNALFYNRIRAFICFSLALMASWLMIATQPSYAAPRASEVTQTQNTAASESRSEAYEKATEIIDDPRGVEKTYEENMKTYKQENPSNNGLIEEAKELVEKVTPSK
ncbi:hypothetical protein [Almyronema epifaneia]|uniref:Low temperature-induced protein n=1 Tax=Almyronema epifaneia S1 TaxID=2991925 RepID=A0ABW6IAC7_9CYAN